MNFLAVLAAMGLEQWRAFHWRGALERVFVAYVRTLERKLNGGTAQQGAIATVAALAPPVLIAVVAFWIADAMHPLLGLVWNVTVLYLLMGFRRFSHAFSEIAAALKAGEVGARAARARAMARRRHAASSRAATSRSSRSSAGSSIPTGRCSRRCSGSRCCRVRRARCCIARPALLADEWEGDARGCRDHADRPRPRRIRRVRRGSCCGCSTGSRCA